MTELAALNVRLQGDASDLRAALQSAEDGLENVENQARRTSRATAATATGAGRLGAAFSRNSFAISNAANQFSDLFVQISAGTPATRALSQQLPQVTAMMGPMAAIAGVASGVLIGLAGSMFQAAGRGVDLGQVLERLTQAIEDAEDATGGMGQALDDLIQVGGVYRQRALEIAQANRELAFYDAAAALEATANAVADDASLNDYRDALRGIQAAQEAMTRDRNMPAALAVATERFQQAQQEAADYAAELGMTQAGATALVAALDNLAAAQGPAAQAQAAQAASAAFLAAAGSIDQMTAAERQIYAQLLQTEEAARRLELVEQRRSALIAQTQRELEQEINIQRDILQYGADSVEVQRRRAQYARAEYEARLQANGVAGQELQTLMDLYDEQQQLTAEANRTADAIARVAAMNLDSFEARVAALAHQLGIAADEARRLLDNLPVGMTYGTPLTSGAGGLLPPSEPSGTTGGGGGGANPLETQIESLRQSLLSQEQVQLESYARQQEMLQQALEQRLITQQEYAQMMEAAQTQHQERMSQIDVWRHGTALQQAETFFGQMANAMQSGNERMMRIGQAFGAAEALINAWRAFNQVIADPSLPFWAKVPAAMGVLSAGLNAVNAIKGIGSGGGASSAGAAASTAATAMPTQNIMIDLVGDTFSRGSVQSLFEQINEGLRNGERIEGILVR